MISFTSSGSWDRTEAFVRRMTTGEIFNSLSKYGAMGQAALSNRTPRDGGATAGAWSYKVEKTATSWEISWTNNNVNKGAQIAILLQYGHGTGTGGYVAGRDYINPAIKPIFDQISAAVGRELARG